MKNIFIWIIIVTIWISVFKTFQIWEPKIYREIKYDKSELLESIKSLKEASRLERIIGLSDSIIAKSIKKISNKINDINNDYYYIIDYTIDHFQKNRMLASMSLDEWHKFKQDKNSWDIMKWASSTLDPYTSQGFRITTLEEIEIEVLKN